MKIEEMFKDVGEMIEYKEVGEEVEMENKMADKSKVERLVRMTEKGKKCKQIDLFTAFGIERIEEERR